MRDNASTSRQNERKYRAKVIAAMFGRFKVDILGFLGRVGTAILAKQKWTTDDVLLCLAHVWLKFDYVACHMLQPSFVLKSARVRLLRGIRPEQKCMRKLCPWRRRPPQLLQPSFVLRSARTRLLRGIRPEQKCPEQKCASTHALFEMSPIPPAIPPAASISVAIVRVDHFWGLIIVCHDGGG